MRHITEDSVSATLFYLGFSENDCFNTAYMGRLLCDPVVAAKIDAAVAKRTGPHARNIYPGDDASVAYIVGQKTHNVSIPGRLPPEECLALRDRIRTWHINSETGLTEPEIS